MNINNKSPLELIVNSKWISITFVCLFIFFREKEYFTRPRVWAEEGSIYIQSYLDNGLLFGFFEQHLGYYSLVNKIIIGLGLAFFPFEYIAHITTYASGLIVLSIVITPLFFISEYWLDYKKKIILLFFPLILSVEEIWLNTINLQFYFGLFGVYLCLIDYQRIELARKIFLAIMTFLGAFTGVTTIILLPFLIFKYLNDCRRNNFFILILVIVLCGLIIQIIAYYHQIFYLQNISRISLGNLINLPKAFFWGLRFPGKIDLFPGALMTIISVLYSIGFVYICILTKFYRLIFLLSYLLFILCFLSLGMSGGPRYFLATSVLQVLIIINSFDKFSFGKYSLIVFSLVMIIFCKCFDFFGRSYYRDYAWTPFQEEYLNVLMKNEKILRIFPQDEKGGWKINLNSP